MRSSPSFASTSPSGRSSSSPCRPHSRTSAPARTDRFASRTTASRSSRWRSYRRRSEMQDRLIFLIGAPRSGTTLLARMLGAHSAIYQRAEPHLITPIAHLGYFGKVQKAPYDQNNVEQALREFVADLPRGEADYLDALRAYTDT